MGKPTKSSSSSSKSAKSSRKSRSRQRSSSAKRSGRSRSRSPATARTTRSAAKAKARQRSASSTSSDRGASPGRRAAPKAKRPLNGYNLYIREQMKDRKFTKGQCAVEMKNLAAKWKAMSVDEQKKYKGMADDANRGSGAGAK